MNAREMQVSFERRIMLMNPEFELKEKLTSDTIFDFLNSYTERFVRNNYLQEDQVVDKSRVQKKNADALKGLIVRTILPKHVEILPNNLSGSQSNSTHVTANNTDVNTDNSSTKFALPDDYFLYIRSNSRVSSTYKGSTVLTREVEGDNGTITENIYNYSNTVINKTIREDDIANILSTVDNRAILRNPYVVLNAGYKTDATDNVYLNVIHDTYTTIDQVDLVYYRKPRRFDVIGVDNETILDHCELPENVHQEIVDGAVEMFITETKYRLNLKSQ